MPMARNLKDKQSVVRSKQYMNMCNYDKALAMFKRVIVWNNKPYYGVI